MRRTSADARAARRGNRNPLRRWRWQTVATWLLWLAAVSIGPVLELRWLPPSTSSFMLRAEGLARWQGQTDARVRYRWVEWEDLSPHLALAVIAAEDQRFLQHAGFDFNALQFAWKYNQGHRRVRGGSTITQQTAKNLFLYPERSYFRKAMEAYFTALLELSWSKRRIMEIYLNIAQFGDGIFGAAAASEGYFRKSPAELTPGEAALLAAVLPNPRKLKANQPSRFVKARRDWILRQMKQLGGTAYVAALK